MGKNDITFSLHLTLDGKEHLVTAAAAAKEVQRAVDQSRTAAEKCSKAFLGFNNAVTAISTMRTALQGLFEENNAYSASMAKANTMAGKSGQELDQLKGSVADLAKEVPIARDALAEGLYQVVSNGVPESNWIDYLRASAKASVGGVADLGETVKVTSTIIKNYGLTWDDAAAVQDKIQLTAKNGVTSFEQLAQALPRVTGNAATLGVSVDDLMATFSTLTGVTGNTAEVSTQLAAIFTALVKPSSEASKMAAQMGIEFNAAAIKSAGGFRQFLTQLDSSVQQYAAKSGMLSQEIYGKLFGSAESLRALGPLTGQLREKFEQNAQAMAGSAGTIDDAFATMASTGSAQMQMLKNAWGDFTDVVAKAASSIMPALNGVATAGLALNGISTLKTAFASLTQGCSALVARLGTLATALNVSALGSKLAGLKTAWLATQNYILTGSFTAEAAAARITSASLYGTAAAATVAKVALRGLLVATGVGAVMAALGFVIEKVIGYFDSSTTAAQTNASALADNEQATKKLSTAKQLIKDVQADAATRYQAEIQKVQELTRIIRSNAASYADRQAAIKKLQGIIPSYQASIAKDGTLYEKNAKAVDKYIRKLNALAMAEAMRDKLKPYYAQLADIRIAKAKAQKQVQNTRQTIAKANNGKKPEQLTREYGASDATLTPWDKSNADIARRGRAALGQPSQRDKNEQLISAYNQQVAVLDTYTRSEQATIKVISEALGSLTAEESQLYTDLALGKPTGVTTTTPTTTKNHTNKNHTTTDKPAPQGSLEWYDEAIRKCDNYIKTATDATAIQQKLQEKATLQAQRKALAIKLGIEQPDKADTTDALDKLKAQLAAAQADSAQAPTIAAKVRAEAKVSELQSQIDAETARRLRLTAIVNPQQAAQQAAEQRRTDYQGASQKMSTIQADFDNGLISQDEALRQVDELNASIKAKLGEGVKPFKLEVDTGQAQKQIKDFKSTAQNAWSSLSGGVDAVMNLTDTLKGNGSAWEKMSAVINTTFSVMNAVSGVMEFINMLTGSHTAATATDTATTEAHTAATATDTAVTNTDTTAKAGNALAGAAKGGSSLPFPANIAAIAAGVAAVVAVIAMISSLAFEHGGIVPGTSLTGDRVTARVNSGEMIINRRQQLNLWRLANTRIAPPPSATPATLTPATRITPAAIAQLTQPRRLDIAVTGRIAGRDIKLTLDKRNTLLARS
ncbi:phage tail tape measure protein [Prevotellamassilia timonensis]|uniref:phage tail tape measure protein n=1 Tax=Prevotellamassilia timonensis TaxID=1852370 RepID=UPI00307CDC04